jgi:protein-disulfide isomerase
MTKEWRVGVAGALAGAVIAIAVVVGLSASENLPGSFSGDKINDYLMAHPDILLAMSAKLRMEREVAAIEARKAAVARLGVKPFFNPRIAFVTGPKDAKVTLVEFFDYNCVHCRNSLEAMKRFYKSRPDVRYAFIDFPIFGDDSLLAARAGVAARNQPDKFMAFHFALMGTKGPANADSIFAAARTAGLDMKKLQADMNDPALPAQIDAAHALADAAAIDGTPAFIVNGKIREGEVTDALLAKMAKG